MDNQFITASELAERLHVSLPTVRAWVRTTDMPRLRARRLVRFRLDEVVAWLRDGGSLAAGRRTKEERARTAQESGCRP